MNKKNLKLYINKTIVDLEPSNLSYNITKEITDYSDISKRNGDFTYSLKIPITKTNQKIFKHINLLYTSNKFNKNNYYQCSFYTNDNLLIDGYFILTEIDEKYYNGFITNKIAGIFNLFGDKTLQDIQSLPKIDFEGVMIPFYVNNNERVYYSNANMLNPSLGFDFFALMNSKKNVNTGMYGGAIDYTEYYRNPMIAYSNFPTDKDVLGKKVITNNLSLDDFKPSLRLTKVIEKLFEDIGYVVDLQIDELDENLLIPYIGKESPVWNWTHLSKMKVYNDLQFFNSVQYDYVYSGAKNGNVYTRRPLISSRMTQNRTMNFISDYDKQYTDHYQTLSLGDKSVETSLTADIEADAKIHLIPINRINYDYNNNYSFYNFPFFDGMDSYNSGQVYTTPVSGKYNFKINIDHSIYLSKFFDYGTTSFLSLNFLKDNEKSTKGNYVDGYVNNNIASGTWNYTNYEKFYIQNMVVVCRVGSEDDIISSVLNSMKDNIRQWKGFPYELDTLKRMQNINNDNIIAFYHPMLRDLYGGESGQRTWEEFLENEKTLYKENTVYPLTDNQKLTHFGFGKNTDILKFDNNIISDYVRLVPIDTTLAQSNLDQIINYQSNTEQIKRKLVKIYSNNNKLLSIAPPIFLRQPERVSWEGRAYGNVDWEFNTQLSKGEQVRMYYLTINQYGMVMSENPYSTGVQNYIYSPTNKYQDMFQDEIKVNKFEISCITEEYSSQLNLANFLPSISQKSFIQDFIKSNNLYFDINENNITFKKRKDFISNVVQKDLTKNIDASRIKIIPIENYKTIQYGLNYSDSDDYKEQIKIENPILSIDNGQNIYLKNEVLDLSSKIFNSSYNTFYRFYFYDVIYDGRWKLADTIANYKIGNITLTSLNQGDSSNENLADAEPTFDRSPRLLYQDDTEPFTQPIDYMIDNQQSMLVNGIKMKYSSSEIQNTLSNIGVLKNTNRVEQFNDKFSDLQDSCYVEVFAYLNEVEFANLDLSKAVSIDNSIYYIQKIDSYNPILNGLTKLKLLRL